MASDMQFWSVVVPPGGSETQDIEQSQNIAVFLHLTNVALAGDVGSGPHMVAVTVNGKQCVIATLQKGQAMQHHLDVMLDETATFTNSGSGPVHLAGYMTMSSVDDDDEDEEDEDEEEDDEDAPMGVPLQNGKAHRHRLQGRVFHDDGDDDDDGEDEDEDEDEEDEDEEDDERPKIRPSARLQRAMDGEDEDEFELGSDDIVGEFDDDDDDDDEGEEEDEDEDEDQEEEEERPQLVKGKAQLAGKRAPVTTTPAPAAKKAKAEVAKAPASAPPKLQKQQQQKQKQEAPAQKQPTTAQKPSKDASEGGGDAKTYEKALVDYLSKQPNKTATLSNLGSHVKRPPTVPKLAAFCKSRTGLFRHDEKGGTVSLLK